MPIRARLLFVAVLAFASSAFTRAYANEAAQTAPAGVEVRPVQYGIGPGHPPGYPPYGYGYRRPYAPFGYRDYRPYPYAPYGYGDYRPYAYPPPGYRYYPPYGGYPLYGGPVASFSFGGPGWRVGFGVVPF